MEFLMGLFVGLAFWEILFFGAFFCCGFFISQQIEEIWGSVTCLFLFVAIGQFFGFVDFIGAFRDSPLMIFVTLIGYAFIGGIWTMFVAWPNWLKSEARDIRNAHEDWKEFDKPELGRPFAPQFIKSYRYRGWLASENKARITNMMIWWIFDAIWRVISDPVSWLWNTVYNFFASSFHKIGVKTTDRILNDD